MSTSETYDFGSSENEQIIREAYERLKVSPSLLTDQQIKSALRSLNFIFVSWVNRRLNRFTIKQGMISLNPGQSSYLMPSTVASILKGSLRTSYRNLGGTPFSSPGGVAINAFDGNINTSCAQSGPNGYISYSWGGTNRPITMIGITSFVDANYTLRAQYSYDGIDWTDKDVLILPSTAFQKNVLQWFSIPVAIPAPYFRIIETGGATLNISELYFNNNVTDSLLSPCSWSEYHNYPDKDRVGDPSQYLFDRQIEPILRFYQTPSNLYNCFYFTYKKQIQDIGAMIDTAEVPTRFISAMTAELAYQLAIKEKALDMISVLKSEAVEAFKYAEFDDEDNVPINIRVKPSSNRIRP